MMKVKVVHNSDNTFEEYMRLMEENIDDLDCQKEIIIHSESFDWIFSYEQDQPSSNVSLTWADVLNKDDFVVKSCHLEREWNIENTAPECYLRKTEEYREFWLSRCKKKQKSSLNKEYARELIVLYRELEALEGHLSPDNSIQGLIGKFDQYFGIALILLSLIQICGSTMKFGKDSQNCLF